MCVYIYIYIYILSLSPYIYIYIYAFYIYLISIYLSGIYISLSIHLSLSLYIYIYTSLSLSIYIYIYTYLSSIYLVHVTPRQVAGVVVSLFGVWVYQKKGGTAAQPSPCAYIYIYIYRDNNLGYLSLSIYIYIYVYIYIYIYIYICIEREPARLLEPVTGALLSQLRIRGTFWGHASGRPGTFSKAFSRGGQGYEGARWLQAQTNIRIPSLPFTHEPQQVLDGSIGSQSYFLSHLV